MRMYVGIGYDIHRLFPGRPLKIGGVDIPFIKGLEGHSDADVLLHAVCDAILGAIGDADIGSIFPDTDPEFKDVSGKTLLADAGARAAAKNLKISNIDCVIMAEEPKIALYRDEIRRSISEVLNISSDVVNVKGKTNEGLGAIGSGTAIAAQAVVLVVGE